MSLTNWAPLKLTIFPIPLVLAWVTEGDHTRWPAHETLRQTLKIIFPYINKSEKFQRLSKKSAKVPQRTASFGVVNFFALMPLASREVGGLYLMRPLGVMITRVAFVPRLRGTAPKLIGIGLAQFPAPLADRLIRNDDPTGGQQFFHIAIAEAEAVGEPHAVADNLRGETVVFM